MAYCLKATLKGERERAGRKATLSREALARHSATFNCQTRVSHSLPAGIHRMKHEMGVKSDESETTTTLLQQTPLCSLNHECAPTLTGYGTFQTVLFAPTGQHCLSSFLLISCYFLFPPRFSNLRGKIEGKQSFEKGN